MKFNVYERGVYPKELLDSFGLCKDNWDDFGYKTRFKACYFDQNGSQHTLGNVRIGFKGMTSGYVKDSLPSEFEDLSDEFFSLGSENYYKALNSLGKDVYEIICQSLNDMAYNHDIINENKDEEVVRVSLLREHSSIFAVRNQLKRILEGGAELTPYNFQYNTQKLYDDKSFAPISLDFNVIPNSNPPTNIHILIGRNGTGKTKLIRDMVTSLKAPNDSCGSFRAIDAVTEIIRGVVTSLKVSNDSCDSINNAIVLKDLFANVLCVAFSPFDDFSNISKEEDSILPFSYIGLNRENPNLLEVIHSKFLEYFENCMRSQQKKDRWKTTIDYLNLDPTFDESQVHIFKEEWENDKTKEKNNAKNTIAEIFKTLSSGHKVTLLIITACVDKLEEKSIMFLDEPENHLHPPLLSAFIRALSYLLINRNGVAIVSTHSPVVLQEVPKSCVWKLNRTNTILKAERIDTETFGAGISSLTREVFGLEVTRSGFQKMIDDTVRDNINDSYDDIIKKFDNQLGDEARYILMALLACREKGLNN